MGFCDASVLQGPMTCITIERVTLMSFAFEVHIQPLEAKELAHPQARAHIEKDQSFLSELQQIQY